MLSSSSIAVGAVEVGDHVRRGQAAEDVQAAAQAEHVGTGAAGGGVAGVALGAEVDRVVARPAADRR